MVVIEHNLDVVKTADWIIDLGPGGGENGGRVIATGTPRDIAANPASDTGKFLLPLLPATPAIRPSKQSPNEKSAAPRR